MATAHQRMVVFCLIAVAAVALPSFAGAQTTYVYLSSAPGDSVGRGETHLWTEGDGDIEASVSLQHAVLIRMVASSATWTFQFRAPGYVPPEPGVYDSAVSLASQSATDAGLSISNGGVSCWPTTGEFVVLDAVYNTASDVQLFAADFVYRCAGGMGDLRGSIRYRAGPHHSLHPLWFAALKESPLGELVSVAGSGRMNIPDVAPDVAWTVNTAAPWLRISNDAGVGPGFFTVMVVNDENVLGGSERLVAHVEVEFQPHGETVTIEVTVDVRFVSSTSLHLRSDPDDYIGRGQQRALTLPQHVFRVRTFTSSPGRGSVSVTVESADDVDHEYWSLWFSGPDLTLPESGLYESAHSHSSIERAGFSVSANGSACNTLRGWFVVHEAEYGPDGTLKRFSADFEQHCEFASAALRGSIRFNVSQELSLPTLWFDAVKDGAEGELLSVTTPQVIHITPVPATIAWNVGSQSPWISVSGHSGSGTGTAEISIVNTANSVGSSTLLIAPVTIEFSSSSTPTTLWVILQTQSANSTFFYINSLQGDPIGGGRTQTLTPLDGRFAPVATLAAYNKQVIRVRFEGNDGENVDDWEFAFASPENEPLSPGFYDEAVWYPNGPASMPGISISIAGRNQVVSFGRFVVHEAVFDGAPETSRTSGVLRFSADFEIWHEGASAPLLGSLRYGASLTINRRALWFGGVKAGAEGELRWVTPLQTVRVMDIPADAEWTVSNVAPWIQVTNPAGRGPGTFGLSIVNPGNVIGGWPMLVATVSVSLDSGERTSLWVTLTVNLSKSGSPPIGVVDTPLHNTSGLTGSIPVTGWALDDQGVADVGIYRNCLPSDAPGACGMVAGHSVVFLGNATSIAGARPDVEAAFPTTPQAERAGWGYLLLTNMLPHVPTGEPYGGQGPITLYAFARDIEGQQRLLGRTLSDQQPTTITLANDTIAQPYGAIDTPGQGATVSGAQWNFGWVLTPDANTTAGAGDIVVPVDASTIVVYVDGMPVGHPIYDMCRGTVGPTVGGGEFCDDDVASIFGHVAPQPTFTPRGANPTRYRNLDAGRGAIGAFLLDTTSLTNGLHTLAWGVTDSQGRTAGIGSRFFEVFNATAPAAAPPTLMTAAASSLMAAPVVGSDASDASAIQGRSGFDLRTPLQPLKRSSRSGHVVSIPENGRLELRLPGVAEGASVRRGQLRPLPVGSHLDVRTGTFTWVPGPGFIGAYELRFRQGSDWRTVQVRIRPRRPALEEARTVAMALDVQPGAPGRGGRIAVSGWALDEEALTGSGIGAVHVWAVRRDDTSEAPRFLGVALLDGVRPDVAARYGPQFERAGFTHTATLDPGVYDVTAYVWALRTGEFEDARTIRVTVR